MKSKDNMAATAAKLFLSGKTKYTLADLPKFSAETLNEIIAQGKKNTNIARAASNALAMKNPKKR